MSCTKFTSEQYKEMFEECLESDTPIYNKKYGQLTIQDEEIFKQCYHPDIQERKYLPPYWFISNLGTLISMCGGKPYWIYPYLHGTTLCYKFLIHLPDESTQIKSIQHHSLIGIVHGSECYGKSKRLIEEEGIYAFGVNNSDPGNPKVQGHHIDGDRKNNKPENIQFIDDKTHSMIHKPVPGKDASLEEEIKFMQLLSKTAREQEPNAITIFIPGSEKYITATDEIKTKNGSIVSIDGKQHYKPIKGENE